MELFEIISLIILIGLIIINFLLLSKQSYLNPKDLEEKLFTKFKENQNESISLLKNDLLAEIRTSRSENNTNTQATMKTISDTLVSNQNQSSQIQDNRLKELISNISNNQELLKKGIEEKITEFKINFSENIILLQNSTRETNQILTKAQEKQFDLQDKRLSEINLGLTSLLTEKQGNLLTIISERLLQLDKEFKELILENKNYLENIKNTLQSRLEIMQQDNQKQLDKMRETVDEKLQQTLNERITQSFKMVNERLQEVYMGLGEMKALANGVGDLKKVLSNVKTRGIMGELQLGAIIEEILPKEQYEKNIVTKKSTKNRVEYAIKLPGQNDDSIYLPIDAKFPADKYNQLIDAYETGDQALISSAYGVLEQSIKSFARDIHDKYIDPPYTTDFAIMFLPFEGLYAEVVRKGLVDILQKQYKINIAGPTTFAALLNSLQMGFRTLAIQKRSGEVWNVLGAVKGEFVKFEEVLTVAQKRIEQTSSELDKLIGVRTRQINRKLKGVSQLPTNDNIDDLLEE